MSGFDFERMAKSQKAAAEQANGQFVAEFSDLYEFFDKVNDGLRRDGTRAWRLYLTHTVEQYENLRHVSIMFNNSVATHDYNRNYGQVGKDISTNRYFYCFGRLDNGRTNYKKIWFSKKSEMYNSLVSLLVNDDFFGYKYSGL
ncbi:MAG: hypothetical protein KKB37_11180 [Alphaproteobacteria bacterium]|nr:hypothetical protein [Alphaproteobacteria bacterium]